MTGPQRRRRWTLLALFALVAGGGGAWSAYQSRAAKNFAVVEPGVLVRSGRVKPDYLAELVRRHNIKTVFSFTFAGDAEERAACDALGVARHFQYLAGDGVGPDEPYLRFLEIVADPANCPMLVHCSAGVQRTGGATLLFRVLRQGWSWNQAYAEMLAMGNDGNRPQREQLQALVARLRPLQVGAGREPPRR